MLLLCVILFNIILLLSLDVVDKGCCMSELVFPFMSPNTPLVFVSLGKDPFIINGLTLSCNNDD
jgi:hypothetical protein